MYRFSKRKKKKYIYIYIYILVSVLSDVPSVLCSSLISFRGEIQYMKKSQIEHHARELFMHSVESGVVICSYHGGKS